MKYLDTLAARVTNCYSCDRVGPLSPRSRCVTCEYERSVANERENEMLQQANQRLKEESSCLIAENGKLQQSIRELEWRASK